MCEGKRTITAARIGNEERKRERHEVRERESNESVVGEERTNGESKKSRETVRAMRMKGPLRVSARER